MYCAFCQYAKPYRGVMAVMIVHGTSVCLGHVNNASTNGFRADLHRLQMEEE